MRPDTCLHLTTSHADPEHRACVSGGVQTCVEALEDALARHGCPEVFNTDQGSQFTSRAFTEALEHRGIKISMDGRGRFMDNVFIERL